MGYRTVVVGTDGSTHFFRLTAPPVVRKPHSHAEVVRKPPSHNR